MEKYISGEEHIKSSRTSPTQPTYNSKYIIATVILVLALTLSFYGGTQYQKSHSSSSNSSSSRLAGFGGGHFGRNGRVVGSVTAISPTSISVNSRFDNSTTTLSITSSTAITDNSQTVTTSDIKVGDLVLITKDTTNTSQADQIVVNPSFGGYPGSGPQQSSGSATSSGSQTTSGSSVTQ